MLDEIEPNHGIVAERLIKRLQGFGHGLGLDDENIRDIVDRVITDMPVTSDEDRVAEARNWMLIAGSA
ncbi:hypothetical protein MKK67_18570 [Methylobacterium sp. J-072]|uniref:hypothetical protein n=1 Tax=Methylobacterium sp. J-072 TaxID=2836651 RepID=UPI001FBA19D1|nr:hypothetical protein [Methylobacterium sp. J-072]MCJ2094479.1 hypothetical protein [Methylobacterium sp. J-072]